MNLQQDLENRLNLSYELDDYTPIEKKLRL